MPHLISQSKLPHCRHIGYFIISTAVLSTATLHYHHSSLSFPSSQRQQAKMPIYQARMILMPAWMKEPCMLHAAPNTSPRCRQGHMVRAMWLIMLLLLHQQNASRLVYEALEDVLRYNKINSSSIQSTFSPKISQYSYLTLLRSMIHPCSIPCVTRPSSLRFPNHLIYHHYRLLKR